MEFGEVSILTNSPFYVLSSEEEEGEIREIPDSALLKCLLLLFMIRMDRMYLRLKKYMLSLQLGNRLNKKRLLCINSPCREAQKINTSLLEICLFKKLRMRVKVV